MESFDLDLEDLDLKTVDMSMSSDIKNVSFQGNKSPSFSLQPSKPSLTVSNNNNDLMPSGGYGLSTDRNIDFGLDLLMNKKKIRPDAEVNKLGSTSPTPNNNSMFNTILNSGNGNGNGNGNSNNIGNAGGYPEKVNLDDTELLQKSLFDDNLTNIDLDKELNTMDLNDIARPASTNTTGGMNGPSLPNFSSPSANTTSQNYTSSYMGNNGGAGNGSGNSGYSNSINTGGISSTENLSFSEIQQRKFDLLCKFERLRDKGVRLPKNFSMSSDYYEMEQEYKRIVEHRQLDNSVKMQKKMLLSFCSGLEMLNSKFDPFDVHLDGWSESVNESINDGSYDDCLEEIYYKYRDSVNMAPELKLAGMVAMSGFWYHITQNMAKSFMPNLMNNVMKQNPDLMNQFQQATMNSMGQSNPGFAQFMSNMTPGMGSGSNTSNGPPKYNPMNSPPFSNPRDAPPRGKTNINTTDDIDALIDSIGN